MQKQRIASLDPASQKNIGWAIIDLQSGLMHKCTADTFVLPTFETRWEVYWPMFQLVDEFLDKHKPDLVIVEKTSSFIGGFVSGQVSQCMGCIFALCGKYNRKVEFAFPTSVKKTVAGHGKATKTQIKKAVKALVLNNNISLDGIGDCSDHAYDAVSNIMFYLLQKGNIKPLDKFPWLTAKQQKTYDKGKKSAKKK